jgi:hypothetical protein
VRPSISQPVPIGWSPAQIAALGREAETFADMSKSRALGFTDFQDSMRSFLDLFDTLRAHRVIPPVS